MRTLEDGGYFVKEQFMVNVGEGAFGFKPLLICVLTVMKNKRELYLFLKFEVWFLPKWVHEVS